MEEEMQKSFVKGGDLIKLRQTELGLCLTADNYYNGENPEAYLYNYNGDYKEERETLNSIFTVEIPTSFYRGVVCQQNEKSSFTLRHLITGKVLSVEDIEVEGESFKSLVLKDENEAKIKFLPTVVQGS
jgi:hypothetical protein